MMFKMLFPAAAMVAVVGCSDDSLHVVRNGSVMTVRVTPEQILKLNLPLHQAFEEQVVASREAPATFELILGPGVYERGFTLRDSGQQSDLEVIVRGAPGEVSTIKSVVQVHAARIRMENLVFADGAIVIPTTIFTVGESLHIEDVSWVGNTRTEKAMNDPLVSIQSGYQRGPGQITVKDSWFVGNVLEGIGNLVQVGTPTKNLTNVPTMRFTNTVFADNRCSAVVEPQFSESVTFDHAYVHETHADGFLSIRNTTTKAHFDSGRLVFAGTDGVVRNRRTDRIPPDAFPPVTFTNVKPVLGAAAASHKSPSDLEAQARSGARPDRSLFEGG